jgi:hypothetical protein
LIYFPGTTLEARVICSAKNTRYVPNVSQQIRKL